MTKTTQSDPLQQLAEHLAARHHVNYGPVSYVHRGGQDYDVHGVNAYDAKIHFGMRVHSIHGRYVTFSEGGQLGGCDFGAFRFAEASQ
jgi:hypothetical protein